MSPAAGRIEALRERFSLDSVRREGWEIGFRRGKEVGLVAGRIDLARWALRAILRSRFVLGEVLVPLCLGHRPCFQDLVYPDLPRTRLMAPGLLLYLDATFQGEREAGFRKGFEDGHAEGMILEAREVIRRTLRGRFGAPADGVEGRLEGIADTGELRSLIEEAAVAPTLDEFLRKVRAP